MGAGAVALGISILRLLRDVVGRVAAVSDEPDVDETVGQIIEQGWAVRDLNP